MTINFNTPLPSYLSQVGQPLAPRRPAPTAPSMDWLFFDLGNFAKIFKVEKNESFLGTSISDRVVYDLAKNKDEYNQSLTNATIDLAGGNDDLLVAARDILNNFILGRTGDDSVSFVELAPEWEEGTKSNNHLDLGEGNDRFSYQYLSNSLVQGGNGNDSVTINRTDFGGDNNVLTDVERISADADPNNLSFSYNRADDTLKFTDQNSGNNLFAVGAQTQGTTFWGQDGKDYNVFGYVDNNHQLRTLDSADLADSSPDRLGRVIAFNFQGFGERATVNKTGSDPVQYQDRDPGIIDWGKVPDTYDQNTAAPTCVMRGRGPVMTIMATPDSITYDKETDTLKLNHSQYGELELHDIKASNERAFMTLTNDGTINGYVTDDGEVRTINFATATEEERNAFDIGAWARAIQSSPAPEATNAATDAVPDTASEVPADE